MRRPLLFAALALLLAPTAIAAQQELDVYLHEYSGGLHIIPEQINARVGDTLKLTVRNEGATPHNFRVCGDPSTPRETCTEVWGFTGMIASNDTAPVQVQVKRAGTFDYYCYIAGHKTGGMTGTLVVTGDDAKAIPGAPMALVLLMLAALAFQGGRRR